MDKFFIRFCLQRSQGTFGNEFPYEHFMNAEKEEIDAFLSECEDWTGEQADKLCSELDLTKLRSKKVMFLGDSLTADRLSYRAIVTKAGELTPCNAAISGAVSTDMLRCLRDNLLGFKPDIISIMIGTNDSLFVADGINLVSPDEYRRNLDALISIGKDTGAEVVVSTLPPVVEERIKMATKTNNNRNVEAYCEIIREVAAKHNAILNDFFKEAKKLPAEKIIETDGVHLTPYGHSKFAYFWLEKLQI